MVYQARIRIVFVAIETAAAIPCLVSKNTSDNIHINGAFSRFTKHDADWFRSDIRARDCCLSIFKTHLAVFHAPVYSENDGARMLFLSVVKYAAISRERDNRGIGVARTSNLSRLLLVKRKLFPLHTHLHFRAMIIAPKYCRVFRTRVPHTQEIVPKQRISAGIFRAVRI